jgi:hypothetical protein
MHSEQLYIGGCLTDNTLVDQGILQGQQMSDTIFVASRN